MSYIGHGTFGEVVRAFERSSKEEVAIKFIKNKLDSYQETLVLLREVELLIKLSDLKQNIFTPKLKDIIVYESQGVFLVMDYTRYSLKNLLSNRRPNTFTEEHVKVIMFNLLCSVNFLHSANIIHRDIKPSNILMDAESRVKICDFGYSRSVPIATRSKH